jgi:hypothetical protein
LNLSIQLVCTIARFSLIKLMNSSRIFIGA